MKKNYLSRWSAMLLLLTMSAAQMNAQDVSVALDATKTTPMSLDNGDITITSASVSGTYWNTTNKADSYFTVNANNGKYLARVDIVYACGSSGNKPRVGTLATGTTYYNAQFFNSSMPGGSQPSISFIAPADASATTCYFGRPFATNQFGLTHNTSGASDIRVLSVQIWYKAVSCTAIATNFDVTASTNEVCGDATNAEIGLSGSQADVSYQLYNGATAVGSPEPGTGSEITFGSFGEGSYSVKAKGTGDGFCTTEVAMTGSTQEVTASSAACTEPIITVDPTSLDFGVVKAGSSETLSFLVAGMNLEEAISIEYPAGFSGVTSVAADAENFEVVVTFNGATDANGVITITSGTAETKEIAVSAAVDGTPPAKIAYTPAATTEVATGTPVTVTFDENISVADITLITVNGVQAGAAADGSTLTVNTVLQPCTDYTVSVAAGAVQDAVGNTNTAATSFTFKTAAAQAKQTVAVAGWNANPTCGGGANSSVSVDPNITVTGGPNGNALVLGRTDRGSSITSTIAIANTSEYASMASFCFRGKIETANAVSYYFNGSSAEEIPYIYTVSTSDVDMSIDIPAGTTSITLVWTQPLGATGGLWMRNVSIGLTSVPLSVNGEKDQTIAQGEDITAIEFTGYKTPAITWGSNGQPAGITATSDAGGDPILRVSGTAIAEPGIYPFTVKVDECTAIQGSITIMPPASSGALSAFSIKWSDAVITQPSETNEYIGTVQFGIVETDNAGGCDETTFELSDCSDCALYLDEDELEIITIVTPSGSTEAAWVCGYVPGTVGTLKVIDLSQTTDTPGKSLGGGTIIAEYSLTIGAISTDVNNPSVAKEVQDCFTVTGIKTDCDKPGIVIKRFTDGSVQKEWVK